MGTRRLTLKGPVKWCKVFEDNRDMKGFEGAYEDHGGGYTIEVGLDEDEMSKLKASKSMKKGREGDDGLTWVKFLRKHEDRFDWAGGPPKVYTPEGDEWDFENEGMIGNDSEAEVTLTVYDTSRPSIKGTRLETVKVTRHIPAEQREDESMPF